VNILATSPFFKVETGSSDARGEKWQVMLLTEIAVGNATPSHREKKEKERQGRGDFF